VSLALKKHRDPGVNSGTAKKKKENQIVRDDIMEKRVYIYRGFVY